MRIHEFIHRKISEMIFPFLPMIHSTNNYEFLLGVTQYLVVNERDEKLSLTLGCLLSIEGKGVEEE